MENNQLWHWLIYAIVWGQQHWTRQFILTLSFVFNSALFSLLCSGMRMTSGQVHFKCLILNWRRNIDKNNRRKENRSASITCVWSLPLILYTAFVSHSQSWISCFVCLFDLFCFFFRFFSEKRLENKVTVYNITKMNNDYINEPPCADIFILSLVKFWKFKIEKRKEKTTSIYRCYIDAVRYSIYVYI